MPEIKEKPVENIQFDCVLEKGRTKHRWIGEIKRFIDYGSHYEMFVVSRSSIMVLFGKTSRGNFACMPDYDSGCHLVELHDKFWNEEKLCSILGKVDGVTVAAALYQLAKNNYIKY